MCCVAQTLKEARKQMGLSQLELCQMADVSLATVQSIESGRANPAIGTIEKIAGCLGLTLNVQHADANWDTLVDHGLPLSKESDLHQIPSLKTLLIHLNRAVHEVRLSDPKDANVARKKESLVALLLAIKISFPAIYKRYFSHSKIYNKLIPKKISGRIIKLERMARVVLGEYL